MSLFEIVVKGEDCRGEHYTAEEELGKTRVASEHHGDSVTCSIEDNDQKED
jgi:hypothetical protein